MTGCMRTWKTHDACLSIFRDVYESGALVFPSQAQVLEIGCAEADWMTPMLAERPDLNITGVDWRACRRPGRVIRGDVLTVDLPRASFDAVVGISSIEHVGLGHYEADPLDPDGDYHCMERVTQWLKPGGWVYADVPYGQAYRVEGTSHRVYDDTALETRLAPSGLTILRRWFFTTWDDDCTLQEAPPIQDDRMVYVALLLRKE